MTILFASADDNLIASAGQTLAAPRRSCVVTRTGVECLDAVHRVVPEMLILDQRLPWGGVEGVLAILEESDEDWIDDVPILLLTSDNTAYSSTRLRVYTFARIWCERKLTDVVEMFESECVGSN